MLSDDFQHRKLTGVRQCGKTYIVSEFAKEHFKNYVYVNFEETENYSAIFDYDFDVHRIIAEIESVLRTKITAGETLLFFDEIQVCPKAITSLKYFCEKMPELHLISTGSLLGVALKQEQISFPVGKVKSCATMPMIFQNMLLFRKFQKSAGFGILCQFSSQRKTTNSFSRM